MTMQENTKPIRVRIENYGTSQNNARITDADTGQIIDGVSRIELDIGIGDDPVKAKLTVDAAIDITAEAVIEHRCAMCGQSVAGKSGRDEGQIVSILKKKLRWDFPDLNVSISPLENSGGYALNFEGSLPSEEVMDAVAKAFRRYRAEMESDNELG